MKVIIKATECFTERASGDCNAVYSTCDGVNCEDTCYPDFANATKLENQTIIVKDDNK